MVIKKQWHTRLIFAIFAVINVIQWGINFTGGCLEFIEDGELPVGVVWLSFVEFGRLKWHRVQFVLAAGPFQRLPIVLGLFCAATATLSVSLFSLYCRPGRWWLFDMLRLFWWRSLVGFLVGLRRTLFWIIAVAMAERRDSVSYVMSLTASNQRI